MDSHPIPQDVTGFQFKLIGNMTVKQFAYLATGIIMAWVLLQLPISIFIKFPLSIFSAVFGVGLAFFPISGRPMDLMIGHFIKAIFRPTQFVYEKSGTPFFPKAAATTKIYKNNNPFFPKDKLKAYLESQTTEKSKIDEKENNFMVSVSSLAASTPSSPAVGPNLNAPSKPAAVDTSTLKPPLAKPEIKPIKPMPMGIRNTGLPGIPDSPNLITGIIKDARNNPLSNILIEVKDKDGNPVRAFKTNEVGRFASATPLLNGTYTIEFEDPKGQNKFESKTINVTGQIIIPIEILSIDTREELRKSLFSPDASGLNN